MIRRASIAAAALTAALGVVPSTPASATVMVVTAIGTAPDLAPVIDAPTPIVAAATDPSGPGYWLVTTAGSVYTAGTADYHGGFDQAPISHPVVDLAATPTGDGYWMVLSNGTVAAFGDARFLGDAAMLALNAPITAIMATPTGEGYWLVASDGGVFSFGDADFHGSTGSLSLAFPIVDAGTTPSGKGYWLAASDGGVFSFGDAVFHGSLGGLWLNGPILDFEANADGTGYAMLGSDGTVYSFGAARVDARIPVVPGQVAGALALTADGRGAWATSTDAPFGSFLGLDPVAPVPPDSGEGRRVVYSNSEQRVWLVGTTGVVEHTYRVSGRRNTPRPGSYSVYSKSTLASAGHDGITMQYMVRFAKGLGGGNIGFHAIPVYPGGRPLQSESQLGTHRSAGCVRQRITDAITMWDWADLGTPVVVLP